MIDWELSYLPTLKWLPLLYRSILRITHRHGLHTLARLHGALFRQGHIVVLPSGGSVYIPADPHYFGYTSLMHENHIGDVINSCVNQGDACIDVGANLGYFSVIMAARAGNSGMVYAFEPVSETFAVLSLNAQLAGTASMNISAFCHAVSAEDGELLLQRMPHSTLHQVTKPDLNHIQHDQETITAVSLTSCLRALGFERDVALIKIDVEGHELEVLEGMRPLLAQGRIKRMIIEVFPGVSAQRVEGVLRNYPCHIRAWLNSEWREVCLADLEHATDVLVEF